MSASVAATISPASRWRKGADEIQPSTAAPASPVPTGLLNHPAPAPASLLNHRVATSPAPTGLLYRRAALEEDRRGEGSRARRGLLLRPPSAVAAPPERGRPRERRGEREMDGW
uniref:Uncharacterized protein n=1 Tax=Oryza punctata TaxID=4537 RepID=A0A0E0KP12_ORYPU